MLACIMRKLSLGISLEQSKAALAEARVRDQCVASYK